MFKGSIVAIVTPFKNGEIDEESLRQLVEFQIENGTDGIVPCGTTGEASTLDYEEHDRVIEIVVHQAKKRVPIIAGTGSNSTKEAIEITEHAKRVGADGALLVTPYYNKPSQEGLYRHYKTVAEAVALPPGSLQCSGAHRRQYATGNSGPTCGYCQYCRHQGGNRLPAAGIRDHCPLR